MTEATRVDRAKERDTMVDVQIARRGIGGARLLRALRSVPRERFVPEALAELAYEDSPLPIDAGQTISQPFIVAAMIEAAEVGASDSVLEVGAGSGYAAAVLGLVAAQVRTIERHDELASGARSRFENLGYNNIEVRLGDGSAGWPEAAPFDAILVAAAGPEVPAPLKSQLAIGGRLVMPLDASREGAPQHLVKIVRTSESAYDQQVLGAVSFVPLIGQHGWAEVGQRSATRHAPAESRGHGLVDMIAAAAQARPDFDDPAFGRCVDRFADRRSTGAQGVGAGVGSLEQRASDQPGAAWRDLWPK